MTATELRHVVSECSLAGEATIDPVRGRDGLWGASVVTGNKYFFVPRGEGWDEFQRELIASVPVNCWDVRRLLDWPLTDERVVWDVRLLHGGDSTLPSAARAQRSEAFSKYLDLDQRMVAHARALKQVHVDLAAPQAVPPDLLNGWMRARAVAIRDLWLRARAMTASSDKRDMDVLNYEDRWPFILALRQSELNGIHVDANLAEELLRSSQEQATARCLRSISGQAKDGFVTALFNPMGVRTGRCRHETGFNAHGIPKGPARRCITSRHSGGWVCSLDFNASDYRCIIASVGGELAKLYEGADDFHWRTLELMFPALGPKVRGNPNRRKAIKDLIYTHMYGGSWETAQRQTGLSESTLKEIIGKMDEVLAPALEFRERLYMEVMDRGKRILRIPGGREVLVGEEDSPGKLLGLYAQSFSSWAFEQAFVRAHRLLRGGRSCIIFGVHDEVVIDAHPGDLELVERVRLAMQEGGHVIRLRKGRSYYEVE